MMKALIQNVLEASVKINDKIHSQINSGILIFLGLEQGDSQQKSQKLANKIANYRIFKDLNNKMNVSARELNLEALVVSQFTLTAKTNKGLRPSFNQVSHDEAKQLYLYFIKEIKQNLSTKTGIFATDMEISCINNGPVTFMLEI